MRIIRDYKNLPQEAKGSVVAIGNFDGVHRGHVALIEKARAVSVDRGLKAAVLTFAPHPLTVVGSPSKPFLLTTDSQKADLISALGIDFLFAVNFDKEFSRIEASYFIDKILVGDLAVKHVITGEDFIFGYNRKGTSAMLSRAALEHDFGYTGFAAVGTGQEIFSSSLIRKNLEAGKLDKVKEMLGRNFIISGVVIGGNMRGREIHFPTINLDLGGYIHPAFGVYAVRIYISGRDEVLCGAANIGIRPTINGTKELLEVHIFDFSEDIYGKLVSIELIEYIRSEIKFGNMEALKKQIEEDCVTIRKVFL